MFRWTRALALALPLALLAGQGSAHHAPGTIKIAAILSLSGPAAELGAPQLKTLQLYVERLNRDGGLLTHQIELNHADDGGDPRKAAEAAKRLAIPEKADILIGGSITSTALAIAPVLQAAKIPFISIATGRRIGEPHRSWVFSVGPTESLSVLRIFEDLERSRAKLISLVAMDTESGRTAREDVRDYTARGSVMHRKLGIELAAAAAFAPTDAAAAARALEQALGNKAVDAVLAVAFGDAAAAIVRRHRELGSKARLYFTHAAASSNFLALAGATADGVRLTVPPMMVVDLLADRHPQKKPILDYIAAYEAKYGDKPTVAGGYALDALMLAFNAIREGKSLDFNHMRQVLDGTRKFVGVTSTYNFWASDHRTRDPESLRLVEFQGGAMKLLEAD